MVMCSASWMTTGHSLRTPRMRTFLQTFRGGGNTVGRSFPSESLGAGFEAVLIKCAQKAMFSVHFVIGLCMSAWVKAGNKASY